MRADRRTIVLGATAAAAVAAAAVVTVSGRGSPESPEHRRVAAYIEEVDGVQQQLGFRLTRLLAAYRDVTAATSRPEVEAKAAAAESTLRELEQRVARLEPPPEATRLHALILRFVRADIDVAHEVTQLTRFSPRFRTILVGAREASARLGTALESSRLPAPRSVSGTPAEIARARAAYAADAHAAASAQADAVKAYCDALGSVLARLRALRPPPVMRPAYRAQVAALVRTRAAGLALADELRKTQLENVPALSRRFSVAARTAGSVAAQRAQIAAIKAYNARVRATAAAGARIRAEVQRLQRVVG